ncbi:hypothetical protein K435DRAFT_257406 [Dendrothele bispora CBS 962.96]|uniref:Uncharacterized protein n=1 Tax=Dendrothele bispora (strain CBS 962.96) TaxID=1314807 RepID=A0A4S8LMG9_DENBC|nr:hypothetical protein K435DRAFT_257406 [Dendrothele bispora CBS 962.96]
MSSPVSLAPSGTLYAIVEFFNSKLLGKFEDATDEEYLELLKDVVAGRTPSIEPTVSDVRVFRRTRDPVAVEGLFQLYGRFGHRFEADQKIISVKTVSDLAESLRSLETCTFSSIRVHITRFFTKESIPARHWEPVLWNYLREHLRDFQQGFSDGNLEPPVKAFFEHIGYQIHETVPEHPKIESLVDLETAIVVGHLKKSMACKFEGESAQALFNYLTRCRKQFLGPGERYYAKFISVCNSSGTGKTRTVLQLRQFHVPLLYINMRPVSDRKNFPPRNDEIAVLFEHFRSMSSSQFYHSCIVLFRALFQQAYQRMQADSPEKMISRWNEDLASDVSEDNSIRREFFTGVRELYDQVRCLLSQR